MHRSASRGFSLIEVTVTIFVIGIMGVASASLLRAASASRATLHGSIALSIAKNQLEGLRAGGYAAVPASGAFVDAALASLPSGTGTLTTSTYDAKTKQVDVSVGWTESDTGARTITLTTLITETGGL